MDNEGGGHRIQRVPPTETKGRVHTSTVTVSVVNPSVKIESKYFQRNDNDFKVSWFSGTGAGGMHRNKNQTSCRVTHKPTGLTQARQGKSRALNLKEAKKAVLMLLDQRVTNVKSSIIQDKQSQQRGSGQRGDKRRTYRFQDDMVKDHVTGKKASIRKVMSGNIDLLW